MATRRVNFPWATATEVAHRIDLLSLDGAAHQCVEVDEVAGAMTILGEQGATELVLQLGTNAPEPGPIAVALRVARERGDLSPLRFVLDPGHYPAEYDHLTGKLVEDVDGIRVSEYEDINRPMAELLARELSARGAQVEITEPGKPAGESFSRFNERELTRRARYAGDAFDGEGAHVLVSLHADARTGKVGTEIDNGTMIYVPAFPANRLHTREGRLQFAGHLASSDAWNAQVTLGRAMLDRVHATLGTPFRSANWDIHQGVTNAIGDPDGGLLGRSLRVLRDVPRPLAADIGPAALLVEAFFYEHPDVFYQLLPDERTVTINGQSYAPLLVSYARALAQGVAAGVGLQPT